MISRVTVQIIRFFFKFFVFIGWESFDFHCEIPVPYIRFFQYIFKVRRSVLY